jgi:hypothetical protein
MDKGPRNIDNLLSKISESSKNKPVEKLDLDSINTNQDINTSSLITNVLKSRKLNFSAKVLLTALIIRDGLEGGKISIITTQDIIGASSTKTAIKVLSDLEKSGLIIRIRTKQFSTYKINPNINEIL